MYSMLLKLVEFCTAVSSCFWLASTAITRSNKWASCLVKMPVPHATSTRVPPQCPAHSICNPLPYLINDCGNSFTKTIILKNLKRKIQLHSFREKVGVSKIPEGSSVRISPQQFFLPWPRCSLSRFDNLEKALRTCHMNNLFHFEEWFKNSMFKKFVLKFVFTNAGWVVSFLQGLRIRFRRFLLLVCADSVTNLIKLSG